MRVKRLAAWLATRVASEAEAGPWGGYHKTMVKRSAAIVKVLNQERCNFEQFRA